LKNLVRMAGLVLLVWLVWSRVEWSELGAALGRLSLPAACALVMLAAADRLMMAIKWRHVSSPLRLDVPAREWISATWAGSFLSYALPTSLGGDVYRGWRLARGDRGKAAAVTSLVLERAVGVVAAVLVAWIGLVVLIARGDAPGARPVLIVLLFATGALLLVLALAGTRSGRARLTALAGRLGAARPLAKLGEAADAYDGRAGLLAANLLLALLENFFPLAIQLGAALALGIPVDPVALVAIAAVAQFLSRASMVLDGWGLSESLRLVTYGLVGISASDTIAIALLGHGAALASSLPGAVVFLRDPDRGGAARSTDPTRVGRVGQIVRRHLTPSPVVSLWYFLRDGARVSLRAEVELSPNLTFGPGCTVSSFTKIKASEGPLSIGAHTGFATGCFLSSGAAGLHVGHDVLFGPNVSVMASHYEHGELDVPFEQQGQRSKGVRIGNNVWIGAGTVVTDGASIGDNTIVAANSLVSRRYPPSVIIQGNPARVIMRRGPSAAPGEESPV